MKRCFYAGFYGESAKSRGCIGLYGVILISPVFQDEGHACDKKSRFMLYPRGKKWH